MLHGVTVDQVLTIATIGFAIAASSIPAARSIARAGARAAPSSNWREGRAGGVGTESDIVSLSRVGQGNRIEWLETKFSIAPTSILRNIQRV